MNAAAHYSDQKHPHSRFWDRMAKGYAKSKIADQASYERKLEITQGCFEPHMEVLEFGCGTGSTAILHAPHVKHILATDISENMLAIGRQRAEEAGVANVTFQQTDLMGLNGAPESFDVVMGMSILHLLQDPEEAIAEAYRLLKPGGVFISSTACIKSMSGILPLVVPVVLPLMRFVGYGPVVVNGFSVKDLTGWIEAKGFAIEHQWQPGKGKAVFIVARKPA